MDTDSQTNQPRMEAQAKPVGVSQGRPSYEHKTGTVYHVSAKQSAQHNSRAEYGYTGRRAHRGWRSSGQTADTQSSMGEQQIEDASGCGIPVDDVRSRLRRVAIPAWWLILIGSILSIMLGVSLLAVSSGALAIIAWPVGAALILLGSSILTLALSAGSAVRQWKRENR